MKRCGRSRIFFSNRRRLDEHSQRKKIRLAWALTLCLFGLNTFIASRFAWPAAALAILVNLLLLTLIAYLVTADAVERRQKDRLAVAKTEAEYRRLFDRNPQPMWLYDVETLAFVAVNEAAVQQYGYSADEFLAMTIKDIRPPEDVPALMEDIRALQGGLRYGEDCRHRKTAA